MVNAMAFWTVAQLKPNGEQRALHFLGLAGFEVYAPRVRVHRATVRGRKVASAPLFPGYAFVLIHLQWTAVRYCPGVQDLVRNGDTPAHVPDRVVDEIRSRERNGLITLPPRLKPGDPVRVVRGPFSDHVGLYAGQAPHERVAILLRILGGRQRVELPMADVEAS
jgi:transcriptional antiterminator RfaH